MGCFNSKPSSAKSNDQAAGYYPAGVTGDTGAGTSYGHHASYGGGGHHTYAGDNGGGGGDGGGGGGGG